jgi:hypothetical protein
MNYLLKSKYALYSAVVFFLFANPYTYHMTEGFFGSFLHIATNDCPTVYGVFFHTFLFFLAMFGLMTVPSLAQGL